MRIIYFCNLPRNPSGGTNVIFRHVQQLNLLGIEAAVLPSRYSPKYHLNTYHVPIISEQDIKENDYFIIPEISAAEIASKLLPKNLPYGIFVQNGHYLSHRARLYSEDDIDLAYLNANSIFSISDYTSAIIKLHYPQIVDRVKRMVCSIDLKQFYPPKNKDPIITYMPRKNSYHANALVFLLKKHIPKHWVIVEIDKLSHNETASLLRKSSIFLSFSNLEGLGLPPIEAALCGNYVIGYHGGGGLDYWEKPNFVSVNVGDLTTFVNSIKHHISEIERQPCCSANSLRSVIHHLQNTYSTDNENRHLLQLSELAKSSVSGKSNRGVALNIQNRASFLHLLLGRCNTRKRKSGWQTSDL